MFALYRKYRPKKLDDLLGQETVVEILKNAAKSDKLAHAYLFFGPRGSGKTTAARLLAKIANCRKRRENEKFKAVGEPCGECSACLEIDEGRAIDVIEIDAASNRGIDEIRNLKESVRVSPASHAYKIYIIDEAHQLTKDAFNALLKTLEEPPSHAIFIMATTEYEKMPSTIASRTQRFHFKKLPLARLIEKLKTIAKAENIKADDEALELIAASAEGSFRDAESLLDQIASLNERIKIESVEAILGKAGFLKTSEMADAIIKGGAESALKHLAEINESGINLTQFNKDLIHYFRRALAMKFSPALETEFKKELTETELNALKKHSKIIDEQKTINFLKSLIRAYTEMRYSPFPLVPLEVAIIENLKNNENNSK